MLPAVKACGLFTTSPGRESLLERYELTPARIAIIYVILGVAALYAFDAILPAYVTEPLMSRLQAVKGLLEVLVTGVLLYGLTRGSRVPLKVKNQRLDRQREELTVLHRVLRHNLRNDLNVIRGYIALIAEEHEEGELAAYCERGLSGVNDLMKYTELADDIRRIDDPETPSDRIDLAACVRDLLQDNPVWLVDAEVVVDLPAVAEVNANHMLPDVIRELVTNAIEHNTAADPRIWIRVESTETGMVQLEIKDNGPGIHPDLVEILESGEESALSHLDGLGLWFVHWTVEASGGRLNIETDPGEGTRVRMMLPTAPEDSAGLVLGAVRAVATT